MKALALIFALLCSAVTFADEPQPNLALNDAQRLRIREVEYQGEKVAIQIFQLQQQLAQVKQRGHELEQQLDAAIDEIAKQNGIDRRKFDFNIDTLTWTAKPEEKKQ